MNGYPYLKGRCQCCGKPTVRDDGEIIDTLITLEKHESGYPMSEYLGEWCSEGCFMKDIKKHLGNSKYKV